MSDHILDLSQLAPERQQVRFVQDGPLYEIATPAELTLAQRAELFGLNAKIERLNSRQKLNHDQAIQLRNAIRRAAEIILIDVPDEIVDGLSDFKLEAVVLSFMIAFGDTISKLAKATGGEVVEAALRRQISES